MPLGTATQKSFQVTYFSLDDAPDFIACMTAVMAISHDSELVYTSVGGANQWQLIITDKRGVVTPTGLIRFVATLGDVLVWDGKQLQVMRIETFHDKYTVP